MDMLKIGSVAHVIIPNSLFLFIYADGTVVKGCLKNTLYEYSTHTLEEAIDIFVSSDLFQNVNINVFYHGYEAYYFNRSNENIFVGLEYLKKIIDAFTDKFLA
jgi:hypothetical protein